MCSTSYSLWPWRQMGKNYKPCSCFDVKREGTGYESSTRPEKLCLKGKTMPQMWFVIRCTLARDVGSSRHLRCYCSMREGLWLQVTLHASNPVPDSRSSRWLMISTEIPFARTQELVRSRIWMHPYRFSCLFTTVLWRESNKSCGSLLSNPRVLQILFQVTFMVVDGGGVCSSGSTQ